MTLATLSPFMFAAWRPCSMLFDEGDDLIKWRANSERAICCSSKRLVDQKWIRDQKGMRPLLPSLLSLLLLLLVYRVAQHESLASLPLSPDVPVADHRRIHASIMLWPPRGCFRFKAAQRAAVEALALSRLSHGLRRQPPASYDVHVALV